MHFDCANRPVSTRSDRKKTGASIELIERNIVCCACFCCCCCQKTSLLSGASSCNHNSYKSVQLILIIHLLYLHTLKLIKWLKIYARHSEANTFYTKSDFFLTSEITQKSITSVKIFHFDRTCVIVISDQLKPWIYMSSVHNVHLYQDTQFILRIHNLRCPHSTLWIVARYSHTNNTYVFVAVYISLINSSCLFQFGSKHTTKKNEREKSNKNHRIDKTLSYVQAATSSRRGNFYFKHHWMQYDRHACDYMKSKLSLVYGHISSLIAHNDSSHNCILTQTRIWKKKKKKNTIDPFMFNFSWQRMCVREFLLISISLLFLYS